MKEDLDTENQFAQTIAACLQSACPSLYTANLVDRYNGRKLVIIEVNSK